MSEQAAASVPFGQKHYFLIRRLHSLSGIVPIGVFLFFHLVMNATILAPAETPGAEFQRSVERIHSLGAFLIPVEMAFIFIPLLFHGLLGVQIWLTSKSNAQHYAYGANIRYTFQRVTGLIALVFILYHVWHMHWLGKPLGGGAFDGHAAATSAAAAIQASWWVAPLYAVGVLCAVYHFANGIWTALITWGITIRPESQRVSGYVCTAIGIFLGIVGLGALGGFVTFRAPTEHRTTTVEAPVDGAPIVTPAHHPESSKGSH